MILAAGFGTRMHPITLNTPKPLIKVYNKPILDYLVESSIKNGITKIIINSHYLHEQILERIDYYRSLYPDITFISIFEEEILESGGAIKNAIEFFDREEIFVINGDIIYLDNNTPTLEFLYQNYQKNYDLFLLLSAKNNAIGYDGLGDFSISESRKIYKSQDNPYINTGIQILKPHVIYKFPERIFSLREVYKSNKNIFGIENTNKWIHIGTPDNLKDAESFLSSIKI